MSESHANQAQISIACRETFEALFSNASHPRTKTNLRNLNVALEHLVEVRSRDFSLANVARAVHQLALSGPRLQSLKNSAGGHFRELINVYALEYRARGRRIDESPEGRLIASIEDPQTRAEVQHILSENSSLKFRHDALKREFQRLQVDPALLLGSGEKPHASSTADRQHQNAAADTTAINRFLRNIERLTDCAWDQMGGLVTAGGHEISGPGLRGVLEGIVAQSEGASR